MTPASGCWKPAIDISVVDLPQPLGPRSVKNSPSRTLKSTQSSARVSPNDFASPVTRISGIATSQARPQEPCSHEDDSNRRDQLHHRQRRDGTDRPLLEELQHRDSDHLVARLD